MGELVVGGVHRLRGGVLLRHAMRNSCLRPQSQPSQRARPCGPPRAGRIRPCRCPAQRPSRPSPGLVQGTQPIRGKALVVQRVGTAGPGVTMTRHRSFSDQSAIGLIFTRPNCSSHSTFFVVRARRRLVAADTGDPGVDVLQCAPRAPPPWPRCSSSARSRARRG